MTPLMVPIRRVVLAVAGGLLALGALAGCSDTADDSGEATSPSPAASAEDSPSADVCADLDEAEASLQAVVDTEIAQEGTNTFKERLATLEADLRTLLEAGQAELAPRTTAVSESLAALEETLQGLTQEPTAADLAQVRPALAAVRTSTEDLITALQSTC